MALVAWVSRRCHLGRSGITRLALVGAIVLWTVIFNVLTFGGRGPPSQPPKDTSGSLAHVRQIIADTLRAAPVTSVRSVAPAVRSAAYGGHEPLSCFTDASTSEQRSFNESEQAMFRYLFDWPEVPTSSCKRMIKFGGIAGGQNCLVDGDKYACLDPPLKLATATDCLVYSFGINYDWSFDEAAERFGCEVHSFDPSIDYPEGARSPGITFHHFGIGRNNHSNVYGWQIYTLDEIVTLLGHENRTIHYLKMDAEGGEFDMMAQQLLDGAGEFVLDKVEQIGFEIHYRLDPRLQMSYYLEANETVTYLRQLGFNMVQWEYNKVVWQRYMFPGVERPVSLLYEILLVKNGVDSWDRSIRGRKEAEAAAAAAAEAEAEAAAQAESASKT
ncbi:uncharacterized protein LOC119109041 [Pollicipes pollicipes]|uniref:uncharacterized protein LOC119109041 n=1 Tax=Pollicipes pollicipes TaxID=41117 RepID=UPI001885020B|nr:uncharacterized protein LOC119109041 [Pollicipes pollicipes]